MSTVVKPPVSGLESDDDFVRMTPECLLSGNVDRVDLHDAHVVSFMLFSWSQWVHAHLDSLSGF